MRRLFLIFITILYASAGYLFGKEQFIYTQISQKEGLTSTVNCIYKEINGEVWIGSPNGLYSFNGNDLKHYSDSCLNGRRIFHIDMDMTGRFWVLTDKGAVLRRTSDKVFFRKEIDNMDSDIQFFSMCQDAQGIWFGSHSKIFRYTYKDDVLTLFCDMTTRPSFICRSIHLIDDRTLMCCSHNGIILIDTLTGEISNIQHGSYKEVSASYVDSMGNIWLAFYNNGIKVFHKDGTLLKTYNTKNSTLSNDVVLCITERNSMIWVGTDGGGINIIDPATNAITVLSHLSGDPSSLPAHSIKSIYTDHYNNVWAGSIRNGLINISRSEMKTYTDVHIGLRNGLSNPTVLCLYQDEHSDAIWIGTDGEGINRFNPGNNEFTHYPKTLKTKVVSIAHYSDEELALSLYADRICLFNKTTGDIRPLKLDDTELNYQIRYAGRSINLFNEKDGDLLIIGNTVNRLYKDSGKCMKINTPDKSKAIGNFLTIGLTEDGVWMHDMHNIYLLEENDTVLHKKGCIGTESIRCGHYGHNDKIWLATGKGICCYDVNDGTFTHISTDLFSEASSIVCDKERRIWAGTSDHLYAYLPESRSFATFGKSDGASPNEYLSKPRLLSIEGDVYMGGVQGLTCIDSAYKIDTYEEPSIKLQGLSIDNEETPPAERNVYEIPRNSKLLGISVSVQEKDIFREKRFRFKISDNEIYETGSPTLSMQRLPPPGTYDIMVSCSKRNGEWSTPANIMTLKVPLPWYLSGWFICTVTVLLLLIATIVYISIMHRRTNRLKLAMKEQEQLVYEEKVRMLINISHELRTPLTLIMAPLKRLIKKMDDNKENTLTLNRIYRQSRRMNDLLDMVLDLRRMEVRKNRLLTENLDFNKWIEDSIEDIKNEENEEGITIVTELDPNVGIIAFDKGKCNTVLTNILINAIKHSNAGDRITIKTTLQDSQMVRVSISDEGPGLGNIDMSKMFTRFYQSNNEQYGSGIGLSYSKILVEMHQGRIGAENNTDKGATFWWEIPTHLSEEDTTTIQGRAFLNELLGHDVNADIQYSDTFDTSGMTLMVVDDNTDLLDFMREALKDDFSEVITATSGHKALNILSSGRLPDIIVSDVNMPDGNGYQLCSILKQNEKYSHIPVVLLTARGEDQSQSDSYRLGADAFMAKPFEVETLLELLKNMLKRKTEIKKKYLDLDEESSSGYGSNEESFILNLNRIISEHLDDPDLDQQLICQELGVSRALLYNRMKSITGSGAKEYITRIRLEKAKSLIEATSLPIVEISEKTGFASQSYFSTAFKAHTGLTPSQYKKQCTASKK